MVFERMFAICVVNNHSKHVMLKMKTDNGYKMNYSEVWLTKAVVEKSNLLTT